MGVWLPLLTVHMFGNPLIGRILLPMHIPVFLCGLICGPRYGFICGLMSPVLSNAVSLMPEYPMLAIMMVELPIYGLVSGLLNRYLRLHAYIALPAAMLAGRLGYGLAFYVLNIIDTISPALSVGVAFTTGLAGIAIQLLIVPVIVDIIMPKNFKKANSGLQKACLFDKSRRQAAQ